ncbi:MAG: EamA family transporter [Lachnospiraceae bacterium]|nr:EamA family transporter [Lachnospiraceae bacterium]
MKKEKTATICILISAILFSTGGLGVKMIPWSGFAINGVRNLISVLLLGAYLKVTGHKIIVNKGVWLGAVCMAGTSTLFSVANKMTTAANTIILQFTAPAFVILFMWLFFRERPRRLDIISCFVVFMGVVFFFIDSISAGNMMGNMLAVLSGISYAGVFMMNTFPGGDPLSSALLGQLLCAVTQMPFVLAETEFTLPVVGATVLLGVFQLGLAYIFMIWGLQHVSAVTAALTSAIEPVLNPILVAVFYKEMISGFSLLGAIIVFAGVVGYNLLKVQKQRASEKL